MRFVRSALALAGALAVAGCGGSNPPMNKAPLTDAEKAAIKEQDKQVDDEERSGSGTATKGPKKGK